MKLALSALLHLPVLLFIDAASLCEFLLSRPTVEVTATEETKEEESKTLRRVKSYTVLTRGDMETLQNDMIERVVSRLGVSSSSAATLLRVANWNEEKLNKEYKNNQAEVRPSVSGTKSSFAADRPIRVVPACP